MEIYKNAVKTERAFICFKNIQHISWDNEPDNMFLLKIYSSAGKIVQLVNKDQFQEFFTWYKVFEGVNG